MQIELHRLQYEADFPEAEEPDAADRTNSFTQLADGIRTLAVKAGWDPYLNLLHTLVQEVNVFGGVQHPGDGGPVLDLRLKAMRTSGWCRLFDQGEGMSGMYLLLNGFVQASFRMVSGADSLVVDAFQAPALVGELERPLHTNAAPQVSSGGHDAGGSIHVMAAPQASQKKRKKQAGPEPYVYYLFLPYQELDKLYEHDGAVLGRLAELSRMRQLQWLPKLAAVRDYRLRIAWLIREWARPDGKNVEIPYAIWSCIFPDGGAYAKSVLRDFPKDVANFDGTDERAGPIRISSIDLTKLDRWIRETVKRLRPRRKRVSRRPE